MCPVLAISVLAFREQMCSTVLAHLHLVLRDSGASTAADDDDNDPRRQRGDDDGRPEPFAGHVRHRRGRLLSLASLLRRSALHGPSLRRRDRHIRQRMRRRLVLVQVHEGQLRSTVLLLPRRKLADKDATEDRTMSSGSIDRRRPSNMQKIIIAHGQIEKLIAYGIDQFSIS